LSKVYYVRGSPTSKYDWGKCAVKDASRALILGGAERNDSQTILSTLACKEAAPDLYITTDLYEEASIQYLDESYLFGGSFWSSDLYMSGRAFCDSIFERFIVCGHYNEHLMDLLQVIITREAFQREQQSRLMGIRVPAPFVNKTYVKYFEFCSLYGCIPVALYRNKENHEYTYNNPASTTVLEANDKIMLLVPNILLKNRTEFDKLEEGNVQGGKIHTDMWRKDMRVGKLEELMEETPYFEFEELGFDKKI